MIIFLMTLCSFVFSNDQIFENNKKLDFILFSYVDSLGNVNYNGIIEDPFALNDYIKFIENISPRSHPLYFKSNNAKKAYWINAYNALILKLMIDNPGDNILDIGYIGYDIFYKKFIVGKENISLQYIENKILRKMNDPRIHFAINCASKSCPPLGNRILVEKQLDNQLDQKAYNFINNTDNVLIDYDSKTIYLNRIFKWFKKDFGDLKKYICKYLEEYQFQKIKNFKIKFFKYNWNKNNSKK